METIEITSCPSCGCNHKYPGISEPRDISIARVAVQPINKTTRLLICPKTGSMYQAIITTSSNGISVETSPTLPTDIALYESAKKELIDSIETVKKFLQSMISLSAGLVPAYLALLSLTSIDWKNTSYLLKVIYILPAFLLLVSCGLFITAYFPRGRKYDIDVIEDVRNARDKIINKQKKWNLSAIILFMLGMLGIIIIIGIRSVN